MTDEQRLHEVGIVKSFVLPNRQSRYLGFLNSPKRRASFTSKLAHFPHLDPAHVLPLPSGRRTAIEIEKHLHERGAPSDCWLISEWPNIDGRSMKLSDALNEVVGRGIGAFVSCIAGTLGYFEDESYRFILYRGK
jgi:hypothetical protein